MSEKKPPQQWTACGLCAGSANFRTRLRALRQRSGSAGLVTAVQHSEQPLQLKNPIAASPRSSKCKPPLLQPC